MDDFEKEYPDFDWKNTPSRKHPGGRNCPCPRHEYIREKIRYTKQANKNNKNKIDFTFMLCPDHYKVYFEEAMPALPFLNRTLLKAFIKIGIVKIKQIAYMESELCYYCKFGTGGYGKKNELPPM